MSNFALAMILKPFVLLAMAVIFIPARLAVQKMKAGRLKRLLLRRIGP